ncbi:sodium-dependent lysophosphatidylcholine symporter 1-B-like, partial [Trichomycterus rosablanca]|uniref:sodium-dependent lysophosphatidylcholine symporter 1-B-like n=1 Tax=Trichomycterus rosablanca TaxID=2290929 RepID=UPI002F354E7E
NDARLQGPGIPLVTKLCYAVGGIPYQATHIAMGFSFQIFLLDVVHMEAYFVSLILFVNRVWDALTDPLIGYLVSRTGRTPLGKFLPWSVLSMPLGILSYALLWFVPHNAASTSVNVPWYLITSCLFQTLMSCYHVPYTSLNMFLGGDERDRDSATAYRMSAEVLSMLIAAVIQGQVLSVYNAEREDSCKDENAEITPSTSSSPTAYLQETRSAFMTSALILGALYFLCCMVLFLGVKEQSGPVGVRIQRHSSYLADLKKIIGHVSYQRLVLGFLFCSLAFQMSLGNFALFCIHVAGLGAQFQYLMLAILISASVSVPMWQMTLVRFGKKRTLFVGLPLFIPAMIILACVSENFPLYMITCVLVGTSVATLFLLPWSMLPDVVDEFMLQNPGCSEMEPLFYSCSCFCNKLGGGLSAGISTMTLHLTGYKTGACSHSKEVILALRLLLAPIPIILLLTGLVLFYLYPVNETLDQKIQEDLEQTRTKTQMISTKKENVGSVQSRSTLGSKRSTKCSSSVKQYSSHLRRSLYYCKMHCNTRANLYNYTACADCRLNSQSCEPRCSSKNTFSVSQCSTQSSSVCNNISSKKAIVTWV